MTLLIKTAKVVLIANRCHGGWQAGQKWALESKGITKLGVTKQEEEQHKGKAKREETMRIGIKNKREGLPWWSSD